MRIIGIDPGTGILGFGVIDFQPHRKPVVVDAGVIATPAHTRLKVRLLDIYNSLNEIIDATSQRSCLSKNYSLLAILRQL